MVQTRYQQVDDAGDILLCQRLVEDDLIQPVEKLWPEGLTQQLIDLVFGLLADLAIGADAIQQELAAQVGSQDDDGIFKIHCAALAIGNAAVVQHLQQDVEHIGMGFFHFVEQDDAVGLASHRFCELPPFFIAHISRRSADQAGYAEFFHVFRHVDAHQIFFAVKQSLSQGFGKLGLPHTGGTEE